MTPLRGLSVSIPAIALMAGLLFPVAAHAQGPQWTRQFGTSRVDQGTAVGYGEFGVYIAGDTVGTLQGQTSAGGKDAFVSLHDESGTLKWIRQFGSTDSREDVATGVAGDGSGAYVVGYTQAVLPSQSRVDGFDSFIRKYDANGVGAGANSVMAPGAVAFGTANGVVEYAGAAFLIRVDATITLL